MSDNTHLMEFLEGDDAMTTASQDALLLASDIELSEGEKKANPKEPTAAESSHKQTLGVLKKIIESTTLSNKSELSMSLQTGTVTVLRPHQNRSRSKSQRTAAKHALGSNVNPHERIMGAHAAHTPKRDRDSDCTPPNAGHPVKKMHGATTLEKPTTSGQELTKSQKKNLKKRLKKQSSGPSQTAGFQNEVNALVPPLTSRSGSNGSDGVASSGNKCGASFQNETNATVPPLTSRSESNVSGSAVLSGNKPEAASSSHVAANKHKQVPKGNESSELPQSYAQVAENHCVAIIDQRKPGEMQLLNQNRFDKLNTLLTNVIMSMIGKKTELPVFDDTRLHGGAMRVRCANTGTRKWLEANVSKLDVKQLWPGARLSVIDYRDIPKPHKFNVYFRGITKPPRDIFALLETQNKGIST